MKLLLACVIIVSALPVSTLATFSIVAVDTVNGEVGSAGASCIGGSVIISDVHPGRGAIHTQSYYTLNNQAIARALMEDNKSPQAILDTLIRREGDDAELRQYGLVDLTEKGPRAAAYTGIRNGDWKGHILGSNYAIQGNILLGSYVLDSMEARFLRSKGSLSDKLMAAMQGANIVGADSRCLTQDQSSMSSFIRVARPGDARNQLFLDLRVTRVDPGIEPIDSLQRLYDKWRQTTRVEERSIATGSPAVVSPNPAAVATSIRLRWPQSSRLIVAFAVYDALGRRIRHADHFHGQKAIDIDTRGLQAGHYICRLVDNKRNVAVGRFVLR